MELCGYCDGTGHLEDCPAREPVEDFADLEMRPTCPGCCPNGCADTSELNRAAKKAQAFIRRLYGPSGRRRYWAW